MRASKYELALEEIYCMAWIARCEIFTNKRDIYATGIVQWRNRLNSARKQLES